MGGLAPELDLRMATRAEVIIGAEADGAVRFAAITAKDSATKPTNANKSAKSLSKRRVRDTQAVVQAETAAEDTAVDGSRLVSTPLAGQMLQKKKKQVWDDSYYRELLLEGKDLEEIIITESKRQRIEGEPVGSLKRHVLEWEGLGCSPITTEWIRMGVPMIFSEDPVQGGFRRNFVQVGPAMRFANEELTRLWYVKAIEVEPNPDSPGYTIPLGTVPKADNKWRLILDATDKGQGPNSFMPHKAFKMEHIDDLLGQIGRGWWGLTFDLRSGFHHVEVREEDRSWLRFMWGGVLYRFVSMPFGPRHSPYFFVKLVKQFVRILRRGCTIDGCKHSDCMFRAAPLGVVVAPYVDDFCICAKTRELAIQIREEIVVPLMKRMGWIRAVDKGAWEPAQRFNFLGLIIDTVRGLVLIPEEKVTKYVKAIEDVLSQSLVTARNLASVAGKVVSVMRAFSPALMYLRSTFSLISQVTEGIAGWNESVQISEQMRDDLGWLAKHLKLNKGRFAWRPAQVLLVATDACTNQGWGATLRIGTQVIRAQGNWSKEEKQMDIYLLEMRAVWLAIQAFSKFLKGRNYQITTDNQICWHTLPVGSRVPTLNKLIKDILDLSMQLDAVMVDVLWIPSELNIVPDYLSRYVDLNDWTISDQAWEAILQMWPKIVIDRFASAENARCKRFNSRFAHPRTEEANALAQVWRRDELSYACPPMAMVNKVLTLVMEQKTRAVIVLPEWPYQPWWPGLQRIAVRWFPLGRAEEAFNRGPSGNAAPFKNREWTFWAVEVDGELT